MTARRASAIKATPAVTASTERALARASALAWIVPLGVVAVTLLTFAPVVRNDFVNWDDSVNLLNNRFYRGLSWEHVQWMFTTFHNSLYRPLTWITLGGDYTLWGMNPAGYHLTSLLLHCVAAGLFYLLALRLLRLSAARGSDFDASAIRVAAGFAALVFAVHPLRVEPIAWASGRENVVAGPFFILTLICYLRAVASPLRSPVYWKWMVAACASYTLSLLGKGAGVTLPIALLILDVYPLSRFGGDVKKRPTRYARWIFLEKAPFFALALAAGLLAIYGKQRSNLMYGLEQYGVIDRAMQTAFGLIFYLWKTLLPFNLSNLYEIEALSMLDWRFVVNAVLLLGFSATFWLLRQRWPWALAAWLFYGVVLLPYVGVAQNGPQIAADRYSYLACLSWALLAGGAWFWVWRASETGKISRPWLYAGHGAAVSAIALLALLSWRQTLVWRDSETLWRHALAINDRSFFAQHFFAEALAANGKRPEAVAHYQKSLALNPRYASARVGLGSVLAELGQGEQAVAEFRQALGLDSNSLVTHYLLANVLAKSGDIDGAIGHYKAALAIDPRDPDTRNNLGLLLAARGEEPQAVEQFELALKSDPSYAKAYFNLGRLRVRRDEVDEGIEQFQQALRLEPEVPEIHEHLGRALALRGRTDEAARHLQEAVRLLKVKERTGNR